VGKQAAGGQFTPYWDKVGAVGHYDYGSLTMARTLGSDPNQVAKNGRRVLVGWIGGGSPASQSLARDLTLSADYELLQAFVPELEVLRQPATLEATRVEAADSAATVPHSAGSLQLEVVATFSWTGANPTAPFGVKVLGGASAMTIDCAGKDPSAPGGCMVSVDGKAGPLMPLGSKTVFLHAIVDHEIIETIANNRTAMVTYNKKIPTAFSTSVALFGATAGIKVRSEMRPSVAPRGPCGVLKTRPPASRRTSRPGRSTRPTTSGPSCECGGRPGRLYDCAAARRGTLCARAREASQRHLYNAMRLLSPFLPGSPSPGITPCLRASNSTVHLILDTESMGAPGCVLHVFTTAYDTTGRRPAGGGCVGCVCGGKVA
jgi:hypothetical protein